MTEIAPPAAMAPLRRELDFVKSLLKSGRSVDEMVAAAKAAARVAARTVEEMKKSAQKRGTELTIRGLPTGSDWDWRALKRWLHSRGVPEVKYAAKDVDSDVGVVRFATEVLCSTAEDMLPTCKPPVEGAVIRVERGVTAELQDRVARKRGREGDEESGRRAKGGPDALNPAPAARIPSVCDAVCPWWQVPYGQQLTDKHACIVEALDAITSEVDRRTYGPNKPAWVREVRGRVDSASAPAPRAPSAGHRGRSAPPAPLALCCPLLGILRSPLLERYRNKSEFTAGLDEHEKPCVGFLRGAFQHGITCVGTPDVTRHTSRAAVTLAAAAADYMRNVSQFAVYDKRKPDGYWRLVLVREGRKKSFLPVPRTATAAAAPDAPAPSAMPDPTFDSLDAFTYLVTFGERTQDPQQATQPQSATAAAAAASDNLVPQEVKDEPQQAAKGQGDGSGVGVKAEGAEAMEVDQAGGGVEGADGGAAGMDVFEVSEAELEQPPPDEVLVMLQVNPSYGPAVSQPSAAARELRAITAHLAAAAAAAGLPLTTIQVQYHTGVANAAPADALIIDVPPAPAAAADAAETEEAKKKEQDVEAAVAAVRGPGYIYDALCELRFRISPTAFFQVNSPATCVLYKVIGDWAAARSSTLLLDICCGTGTIGITMAKRVAKVVGVDSVASAIEDARVNAALNGITNAEFVTGKAEDALPGILTSHASSDDYEDVVAVADPPRAGLHKSVVRALLGCEKIRRLVFVSCNPDNLVENVTALCSPPDNRSGRDRGYGGRGGRDGGFVGSYTPFRPVKAVALDLFPHTAHVEAVMLLER